MKYKNEDYNAEQVLDRLEGIRGLTEKERIVINRSFGLNGEEESTLGEIAEYLFEKGFKTLKGKKMSKVAVFNIKDAALRKMKTELAEIL